MDNIQSQNNLTTDDQSASLSFCQASIWDPRPIFLSLPRKLYLDSWGVVRFEVFTALTMKNGVFWDVTPSHSCKNRRFGGT
jgi:hypothetical protein